MDNLKVSIDGALRTAEHAREEAAVWDARDAPYPIRRRNLLAQINLKAKHYALTDEVQAFALAAGRATVHRLEIEQLEALHGWLLQVIDRLQAACDVEMFPPAR